METIITAQNDNRNNAEIKIILVGDSGVGKSALLDQFRGPNSNDTQPTVCMRCYEIYKKVAVQIRFIDPFHETFSEEKESLTLISQADGVILIYDITNESSFASITDWMAMLKRACSSLFVETMIIVNKSDLEGQRVVSKERGQGMSSQLGALAFREDVT
ncbi:unnamed protein product [Orchesella dallaii]|uniref:Uncharacterized protein n=1 Tax=Orchesella dallaii TaxID=48710 RepID=A0ABP1RYD2_9HEXA